jgi:hypothetical protein
VKLPKLNWVVVAIVVVMTAGVLYVGYNEWQFRLVHSPLQDKLMQFAGVTSVELHNKQHMTVLAISIDQAAQFPQVACQISKLIRQEMQNGASEIVWEDSPNTHLQEVYEQLNLILYEASRTYQFVLMQERIEKIAQAQGVSYQIGVDEESIYLSLQEGSHTMLESIPLLQAGGAAR